MWVLTKVFYPGKLLTGSNVLFGRMLPPRPGKTDPSKELVLEWIKGSQQEEETFIISEENFIKKFIFDIRNVQQKGA